MEQITTFASGMNKDQDPLINKGYFDANNFRLGVEHGSTSPSLINILGNSKRSQIQNTTGVHRLTKLTTGAVNFTIQGQIGAGITITSGSTPLSIYNYLITDGAYTNCVQNVAFTTLTTSSYDIYYNNNYLYIVGSVVNSVQNTITGTSNNNAIVLFSNNYIPAQSGLYIIGSTYIRDDIFLYTTSNTTNNPGGHDSTVVTNPTSVGQIWKMTYDQIADTSTISLVYNNFVDFTAVHPIPPTATTGRYENNLTKRIYWTDNFNSLRSINVADPQVFALDVSLLSIKPAVDFSPPLLQQIVSGGSLYVGSYEAGYRLKNTGGSVTKIGPLSNIVHIVASSESTATGGANFATYHGDTIGTLTSKAITWKIQDIDTDFERIEIVIIFRDIFTDLPTSINIVLDEPIPNTGEFIFTYTGNEEVVSLTLDDLTLIDDTFTQCKTLATKDNRLFVANTKSQKEDLDYDARAYRFPTGSPTFQITEDGIINTYDSTNWTGISATSDAINTTPATQIYKENSTVIGGAGPNISYEFGTIAIRADSVIRMANASTGAPFRHTNPEYLVSELDLDVTRIDSTNLQVYPTNLINDDIKYPYYSSLYKGYERCETYRMGITFYDKQGNPFYTKWVGDVKMPNHNDVNANPLFEDGSSSAAASPDFRMSFIETKSGTSTLFVNQLFIKFTVKIPDSISAIVSGYSICRVERTQENKTVLGSGILNQVVSDGGQFWLPDFQLTDAGAGSAFPYMNVNGTNRSLPLNASDLTPLFDCPEFLLGGFPGYITGDKLRIVSRQNLSYPSNSAVFIDSGAEPYMMYKYLTTDITYGVSNEFTIDAAATIARAGTYLFPTGSWLFNNYTRTDGSPGGEGSDAIGSDTLGVELSTSVLFNVNYGCTEANFKKLIAQYVRVVASQYGGNTYTQRSNNEYINCSHYRPIKAYITSTSTTDTFQVFGGDVFTQMYDNQKQIKNWDGVGLGAYIGGDGGTPGANYSKVSITQFFPCTASQNTDLRHGNHVNKNLNADDSSDASGSESYLYNKSYSNTQNTRKFFPKPSQLVQTIEHDSRVWASDLKINGELVDSWGVFKSDNYWDTEGSYGPINALEILKDRMFFLQNRAFGTLSINPRALVVDASSTVTQLGTGNILERHDYISTEYGSKHQWSVLKSQQTLIWWDTNVKKLVSFNGKLEALSDVKGMAGYLSDNGADYLLNHDNPIYSDLQSNIGCGVHGVYDYNYNEFIITFLNASPPENSGGGESIIVVPNTFTLCYEENINAFTSFYSFKPNIYITNHREIYSPNLQSGADLYLHDRDNYCKFYGTVYQSTVTPIINENPQYIKVFDNLEWVTDSLDYSGTTNITNDTFSSVRAYNSFQNTDFQTLTVNNNLTRKERIWKTFIPRNRVKYTTVNADIFNDLNVGNKSYGERLRDNYMYLDLKYNNNNNYRFVFRLLKTIFRVSSR